MHTSDLHLGNTEILKSSTTEGISVTAAMKTNDEAAPTTTKHAIEYDEFLADNHKDLLSDEYGDEPRNLVVSMLKQLTKGMDLHRVPFPTFVLEPRSMLERMTDNMSHPHLMESSSLHEDPIDRFLDVLRYFISGWHMCPKGVKKPYNPVLGEFFRCRWKAGESNSAFFIAEQVSHHPPVSAYFYANPDSNIVATGNFMPKSRFLGNSIMSVMNGTSTLYFTNRPGEEYSVRNPNMYARGILFGSMFVEVGDTATITCEKTNLMAEIDFKTKGFFNGSCDNIVGKVVRMSTKETLYTIQGKWSDKVYISSCKRIKINHPERPTLVNHLFFDADDCKVASKLVPTLKFQEKMESRRLWKGLTDALLKRNYDLASSEKHIVEEEQRAARRMRESEDCEWEPTYFTCSPSDGVWRIMDRSLFLESPHTIHDSVNEIFLRVFGNSAPDDSSSTAMDRE